MNEKMLSSADIRHVLAASVTTVAVFLGAASTAFAAQPDLPPKPAFNSSMMAAAWRSVPLTCRKQVQRVLTAYKLYTGPIDGVWGPETAHGIAKYTSDVGNLAYGAASFPGAKGILWHIGLEEEDCPMPPYSS